MKGSVFENDPRYELWQHLSNEYGLTLLESDIDEIVRLAIKIKKPKTSNKDVECYGESGMKIGAFKSLREAAKELGIGVNEKIGAGMICHVLKGRQKTTFSKKRGHRVIFKYLTIEQ